METKSHFILLFVLLSVSTAAFGQVKVEETQTTIPTYLVGEPEKDPYFFNGRVYQGAAGHVYPYPIYDILTDERVDRTYKYLTLENEYTEIGVLPEIGGRIFSAVDKGNGYNFFYRQHVIRPALIGMIGSWISGGVEWNIPHHHRASSTLNAGYYITENEDGSKTIWIGETELRQRLKWDIALTISPGKSYVEAKFILQNRTPMMQSFLYWANVSVHANNDYQVQFPPQTVYGTTHSKTAYTDWPFSKIYGEEEASDNSWWRAFKNSNSTFAVNYAQDFLTGYDFGKDAGTVHFADHNVVPGKKFFLWGTESVWNEMLTEDDGAYLELMVGTFSDNQPDYSWIGPNEVRVTKQYWYPIKKIGGAKNANLQAAVNLERVSPTSVMVGFNTTSLYKGARVQLSASGSIIADKVIDIDPNTPFLENYQVPSAVPDQELSAVLYDSEGNELVSYTPVAKEDIKRPHPADRPKEPTEYNSVEELLLAGQRLEELHNARVSPLPYYEEALRRDSLDSRVNVNLGIYYARRAQWTLAEKHLQRAYMRLTGLHYMPEVDYLGALYQTNPKDGEMLYYLGVVSLALGKEKEAEAYFGKSVWYPGYQSAAYRYLSELYWRQGKAVLAQDAIDKSISLGDKSTVSKFIKATQLNSIGNKDGAVNLLSDNIEFDPLDFLSRIELCRLSGGNSGLKEIFGHMGIPLQEVLEAATYYGEAGAYEDAVWLLDYAASNGEKYASTPMQKNAVEPFAASPLLNYMAGYYSSLAGDKDKALSYYRKASSMSPDLCFPFRLEEKAMLEDVISLNPSDAKAPYYLGNLLYYYDRKGEAMESWRKSADIDPSYGMTWRNLGFSADKYLNDKALAAQMYRTAIAADSKDPKFFTEYDAVCESLGIPAGERLSFMEKYRSTVLQSDDATERLVNLYVEKGKYDSALSLLETRHFRVWEGGQTVYTQFVNAHLLRGLGQFAKKHYSKALDDFLAAGTFPRNLETNELSTGPVVSRVAYHQGLAYEALGQEEKAKESFEKSINAADGRFSFGRGNAGEGRYYVAMALRHLGHEDEASEKLKELDVSVDEELDKKDESSSLDIYSKFGEDGSKDAIRADALYVKGLVCLADGNKRTAAEYFDASLKLVPSNVWAKYYRSVCK